MSALITGAALVAVLVGAKKAAQMGVNRVLSRFAHSAH